jgi:predicted DNA-binding protein (MmcQ/YjbR family)
MTERPQVPPALVDRLRRLCLVLPEVREEEAWIGTRWRVRSKTFAHVNMVADGWPPVYARVIGVAADDEPVVVLTFRSAGDELQALANLGRPYFRAPWAPGAAGLLLDHDTDWDEVAELVTESYCLQAPQKLAARVDRPGG